jgi:hypothetical protein
MSIKMPQHQIELNAESVEGTVFAAFYIFFLLQQLFCALCDRIEKKKL